MVDMGTSDPVIQELQTLKLVPNVNKRDVIFGSEIIGYRCTPDETPLCKARRSKTFGRRRRTHFVEIFFTPPLGVPDEAIPKRLLNMFKATACSDAEARLKGEEMLARAEPIRERLGSRWHASIFIRDICERGTHE